MLTVREFLKPHAGAVAEELWAVLADTKLEAGKRVRAACALVDGRILVEVSGGITLETVGSYAAAGADLISTSAITQSAPALDIGLDLQGA